ncbi:Glucosamine-6-phosphate deaminase [Bienertia sinuspersici]
MLDVMNPLEVLGHHARRAELESSDDTFDRRVSTITLSSSPTIVMGQHAGRDEPIGGIAKMVHLKDFVDGKRRYLALVDCEDDLPKSGTCLAIRPSLLRPGSRVKSLVNSQNFRKNMSTVIKLNNVDAYVLQNMMPDRDTTNDKFPLLGRSIMSGSTKWKFNIVKFIGVSFFISGYWEWTEDVLSRFGDILELCSSEKGVSAQQWVDSWCKRSISYNDPLKQKRYTDAPPKSTHNPSGKLTDQPPEWSTKELDLLNSLGIEVEVLPENEDRLIRPGTFEVSILIAMGETFSFAIPVLASIYRGLNVISRQFGFCQDIPSVITRKVPDRSNVSYDEVLMLWKHASQHEGTGDNVCAASSKRLHLTGAMAEVEGEDKSTRCRVGDIDFEMGASFNIDDAMIEEAIELLNVLTNRIILGKGKEIHVEKNLVKRGNFASLTQAHHSVDGPLVFEINAKTLGIPLDAMGILRALSHGDAVPASSIFTICITPASHGIFTSAIKILGNEYLTLLKQTPFDKVSDRHGEASQVYKAIRVMHGDPKPLKCKVDEYVWAVKGHLSLKTSLFDSHCSD